MDFKYVTRFLESLSARGIVGCDLAVALDGKIIYRHMTGMADREAGRKIAADSIYRMYSMTKPITCAAALQLYEQGRFLMSDPVANFLPEFANMKVAFTKPDGQKAEPVPAQRQITMRDLFTMSSGLNYDLESPSLLALYKKPGGFTTAPGNFTTREFAAAIAKEPLQFEPGTHFLYSLSHDVLGAVIEVISGKRLGEYFRENIFVPLGMKNTWFRVPEGELGRVAYCYEPQADGAESKRLPYENKYQRGAQMESGGAGLCSTVEDYLKFASAMANLGKLPGGKRILGKGAVELMRMDHLDPARQADFDWIQFRGYSYGLGVRTLVDPAVAGAFGTPGEFGWGGAAGTYMLMDPAKNLSLVYAQQAMPNDEPYVHPRLRNLVYRAIEE